MAPEVTVRPWNRRKDRSAIERWPAPSIPEHWMRVLPAGQRQSWAIELRSELVGRLSLREIGLVHNTARMGIYLHPDRYGQGIGTAAILAFLPLSPVDFLIADVALDNERARRCYDKAGFMELYVQQGYAVLGRYTHAPNRVISDSAVRSTVH
jgi:RimJ/RimL family protein N-acetyltransferase